MMKKLLCGAALGCLFSVSAMAADFATKAAPTVFLPGPSTNWTGFYAGLHAGYSATDPVVTDTNGGVVPGPFEYKPNGFIGGGQLGYNLQLGSFLVGVEGDLGYMGLKGTGVIGSSVATAHQNLTLDSGWYGDATARVGYLVLPSLLLYGKGGYAYLDTDARQTTTNPGYVTTGTGALSGWVAGAGAEWMFARSLSVKVEYLHYDFGSAGGMQTNVGDPTSPPGFQFTNSTSLKMETVKAGLNYHF